MRLQRPTSNVKTPKFAQDLVRDLRDRHLLIPALALILALVAVPMLLSRSASTVPATPPVAEDAEATAAEAAVTTQRVGVRDYTRRLNQLQEKNPFKEHFSLEVSDGGGLASGGVADAPAGISVGGTSTGSVGATTATATDTSSDTSTGTSSSGSTPPETSTPPSKPKPPPPEVRYLTRRIDVTVGPVGAPEEMDGVRQLRLLPSNGTPVVAFLGVSEEGGKAVFLVSDDVSATAGDGSCFPSGSSCRYLIMRKGDIQTFDYTPDATTYRLKLRRITEVELKDAPGVSVP